MYSASFTNPLAASLSTSSFLCGGWGSVPASVSTAAKATRASRILMRFNMTKDANCGEKVNRQALRGNESFINYVQMPISRKDPAELWISCHNFTILHMPVHCGYLVQVTCSWSIKTHSRSAFAVRYNPCHLDFTIGAAKSMLFKARRQGGYMILCHVAFLSTNNGRPKRLTARKKLLQW